MFSRLVAATCGSSVSALRCLCVARTAEFALSFSCQASLLCSFIAVPTLAVPPNCASLPMTTDFISFVEGTRADPPGWPLTQAHVQSRASMVNAFVPVGPTWHFLLEIHHELCRPRHLLSLPPLCRLVANSLQLRVSARLTISSLPMTVVGTARERRISEPAGAKVWAGAENWTGGLLLRVWVSEPGTVGSYRVHPDTSRDFL